MFSWEEIAFAIYLAGSIGMFAVLLIMVQRQESRYEQFRSEVGLTFGECFEQLQDHNTRLTAAGYPPGRIRDTTPQTGHPSFSEQYLGGIRHKS